MKNKFLAFVVVMCMALTMIPGVAMAAGVACNDACTETTHIAAVGDKHYTDIQDAIVDAAPSNTVELLKDVTVAEWKMFDETMTHADIITLSINGLTIDGNGYTLTIQNIKSGGNGGYLFYDATNLNIKDLTIKQPNGLGGIGLTSGKIENVNIEGGNGVYPGNGDITIDGCTFKTNGPAIYYETARDNLKVTNNTFETTAGQYAIYLRGATTFTGNTVKRGKVNVVGDATGEISGNDFGTERFKVYNGATATISNNKINDLVFNDTTKPAATFTDNTLSEAAEDALEYVGATNNVTAPAPSAKPASTGNGISVKYNGGNSFSTSKSDVPTGVEIDGVAVPFSGTGSNFTVGCVDPSAKWVTVRWNSTSVTTNFTPDGLVECSVSIPKTGDISIMAYAMMAVVAAAGIMRRK